MSRLSKRFLGYTFLIMVIGWGTCMACSLNGILLEEKYLLYIPYLLGGWSPTIASFLALKQEGAVANFKDWLKNIFDFRHGVLSYAMVAVFGVLFILPQCLISGYEKGAPFFLIIVLIPMMLIGGGLEEAGWRYVLQTEFEKKFGFTAATALVAVIWWLWHFPLFHIQGVGQYGQNYIAFGINVLGLSFALAGVRKTAHSVWLCVLLHCIANSLSVVFLIHDNIWGNVASAALMTAGACLIVKLGERKKARREAKQG